MSSTVEAIKERLTAAEVIGRRVLLRQSGRNLRGLCCFHSEKTPSFFVFPESNTYKCFGCNEGGDIFTFVMKTENLEFRDVLRQLAEEAGVPLSEGPRESEQAAARKAHISANNAAVAFFRRQFNDSPAAESAREYAAGRGLDAPTLEQFQMGFAPDAWDGLLSHLTELGYSNEDLVSAGLARSRDDGGVYDWFRDRLMFPISNRRGDIVGFGGRALGDDPAKYMNTPQTAAFDKGGVLYGLNLAAESIRASGTVVVVEGYMDVIAAHQHGFDNVIAAMGTAITPAQVRLLRGLAKRVVLALDADTAGAAATRRSLELLGSETDMSQVSAPGLDTLVQFEDRLDAQIFVAAVPDGQDPDDIIRADPKVWGTIVADAIRLADYIFGVITADTDLTSFSARTDAMKRAVPIIRPISDPALKADYMARLAASLHIREDEIDRELIRRPRRARPAPSSPASGPPDQSPDDYLLALGMNNLRYFRTIANLLHAEDYSSSENSLLAESFTRMDINGDISLKSVRESLDASLHERFDAVERFHREMPQPEGETLFVDMQRVALRLRRNGLRAENRQLQIIQSDGQSIRDNEGLAERQRQILVELREIAQALR